MDLRGHPGQLGYEVIYQGLYKFKKKNTKKNKLPGLERSLRTVYTSTIAQVLSHPKAQTWTTLSSLLTSLPPACP